VQGERIDPQPRISLAGRSIGTITRIASVGGYVVVLATWLDNRGVELQSTYVGHPEVDTHITHLLLARGVHDVECGRVTHGEIPVLYARQRCLYDHFQRLQDFADELGIGPLEVELFDDALIALGG
jgi:hypothetical protein